MDDAELNAIRQARLAELQRNAAGGGSSTNPSSSSFGWRTRSGTREYDHNHIKSSLN